MSKGIDEIGAECLERSRDRSEGFYFGYCLVAFRLTSLVFECYESWYNAKVVGFEEFLGKIKEKIHEIFEEKFWGLLHESWKTIYFENF